MAKVKGQGPMFDGRPVSGVYLEVPGFGKIPLDIDDDSKLQEGDHIECEKVRFCVTSESASSRYDNDGNQVSDRNLVYKVKGVFPLSVAAVLTKADREQAWRRDHGAVEATSGETA
jgi:hypothetical protein